MNIDFINLVLIARHAHKTWTVEFFDGIQTIEPFYGILGQAIRGSLNEYYTSMKEIGRYGLKQSSFIRSDFEFHGSFNARVRTLVLRKTSEIGEGLDTVLPGELASVKAGNRTRDTLAQRNPQWAIKEYPIEFDTGKRIADVYKQVMALVDGYVKDGHKVAAHLRDGEMIYQLALKMGIKNIIPIFSSRPLTTQNNRISGSEFEKYLNRVLPKSVPAIHVDTGFAGSIPLWMKREGWNVTAIKLVSADNPDMQMPITSARRLRSVVIEDMEHCSQRFAEVEKEDWDIGHIRYSYDAPGFWARFYGICEGMGISYEVKKNATSEGEVTACGNVGSIPAVAKDGSYAFSPDKSNNGGGTPC
jgi:hypothetical protein